MATALLLVAGCTASEDQAGSPQPDERPPASTSPNPAEDLPSPTGTTALSADVGASPSTPAADVEVDGAAMREVVDLLAATIGPREATSRSFARAARLVERRLSNLGYEVTTQPVPVPAGTSWGVSVPAGESVNVIAVAPGTDRSEPHLVLGAHLDTVPQAPGAVDNASGISVLLETARLAMLEPPPQPVVFVAFGAEEPRGPGDDLHHFGSQAYVAGLTSRQRAALVGAIAVDSVGISQGGVPVCTADAGPDPFTPAVRQAVRRADVPLRTCVSRTSDHWSFVRNGLDGTRVGLAGIEEYEQYHSAADVPDVVRDRLLTQAAEAVWAAVSRAY